MASSSSISVFDNYRFKTAFNEELYNTIVKNKKVIAECCFDLDDDEYPEIHEQIALRGWTRLAAPKPEISIDLIHEFYANAIITEEEMEEHGGYTYKSFVRGVPINFSPENIRNVMRFRAQVEGATSDFETQKKHDQQLDRELNPIARGWHELSIHSLIPSSNRSEIPVIRAIIIPCIMNGEDVRAEDIIVDKMEAGVAIREFRRTKKIPVEKPITAKRMESTRLPRHLQHQQQDNEDEEQPMPQAGEGNEEGQGYEHDYHHQPEFDHQPEYDHQQDFQEEPQVQQPPLYQVPTYTDQHEKDLHSIETQLQNMRWYQQQCLENINKSQSEYMAELRSIKGKQQEMYDNNDRFYNQIREEQREMAKEIQQTNQYNMIRQEQKLLGKEILDVKKYQMSTVTMGSSSSPQKYEPDQALMKIREQHANFSEVQRQLKEWTRNASARECYTVWAHQQANPNLVEMPVHKVTKQIYDNANNNRPMFYFFLKSDLSPFETTPPPPKSNDPQNAPK
ncbi:hypothetical protein PIB30_082200 [Stylosanthes scabra]|uniref:Putative plant transposon protein domain-containing protein n=1 Tax=Stylosanthes scabra TaxID=79078 RepID=A0ABU6ZQG6_9FABA|nr:hypothetical protein [Stylosanthes scabra]